MTRSRMIPVELTAHEALLVGSAFMFWQAASQRNMKDQGKSAAALINAELRGELDPLLHKFRNAAVFSVQDVGT